jgi:dUTP pyrophosphatase
MEENQVYSVKGCETGHISIRNRVMHNENIHYVENVNVHIELLEGGIMPQYKHCGDAGMDVYAINDMIIKPGATVRVRTGIKLAVPFGYEVQVRPRSGISFNTPLRVANAPGTIDNNFKGEIEVIMTNTSPHNMDITGMPLLTLESEGNQFGTYNIRKGDRIAQIVLEKIPIMELIQVDSIADIGEDRGGGFGSSGITG